MWFTGFMKAISMTANKTDFSPNNKLFFQHDIQLCIFSGSSVLQYILFNDKHFNYNGQLIKWERQSVIKRIKWGL